MSASVPLTVTELLAGSSNVLESAGYRAVPLTGSAFAPANFRLFEDPYAIVGVAVFDTFSELRQAWPEVQGYLVDIMSAALKQTDAKAWDGYLVLLSPGIPERDAEGEVDAIRSDTVRVRKLLATGAELVASAEVERVLLPLLPIGPELRIADPGSSVLDLLPELLFEKGIERASTTAVLKAFREQRPLLEEIHNMPVE